MSQTVATEEPAIILDKVNKWYGTMHVLRDVSLTVGQKERVVVCGPSGSGKSTMIRCINRLETHQEGQIIVDGTELTDDLRALDSRLSGVIVGRAIYEGRFSVEEGLATCSPSA